MYDTAINLINDAKKIIVIQAENPDRDSLCSIIATSASVEGESTALFLQKQGLAPNSAA